MIMISSDGLEETFTSTMSLYTAKPKKTQFGKISEESEETI